MAEPDPGMMTTAQAVMVLAHETPAEMHRLERAGWIKSAGADRWPLIATVQGSIKYWRWRATVATRVELAQAWRVVHQRVGQLVAEGVIKPLEAHRGFFDWSEATGCYVSWLREQDRRSSKSAAESRVRDARAEEIMLRVRLRAGDLMQRSEHVDILDEVVGMFRAELSGLPARLTRDLQERGRIEQAVNDILDRISAAAADTARNLAVARGTGDEANAADNTGPVGSG